jgi:dephospho-CoA kinase
VSTSTLRVGLTGNIASGKSTVAGWLAELGFTVLDLDAIGHECLLAGTPTFREVVTAFGEAILRADGSVDRRALGTIVFGDAAARERLEAILHPAIRELEERRAEEAAAASGCGIVITEAALLYETRAAERYHRMVVVTAPHEMRRRRLQNKGLSDAEALSRMASQMDQARKAELADYVIDNGGTLEAAEQATRTVAGLLRRDLVHHLAAEPLDAAGQSD